MNRPPVYCDMENCKHGCGSWSGDGYNEPREMMFECKKEDQLLDEGYFDFTDDPEGILCPGFESVNTIEIEGSD